MSVISEFLTRLRSALRPTDEDPVRETRRTLDWDESLAKIRHIDPGLAEGVCVLMRCVQALVDDIKVPVYLRLLLKGSSFMAEQKRLKVAIFPVRKDTGPEELEFILEKLAGAVPITVGSGKDADCDIGAYQAFEYGLGMFASPRTLKVFIPSGDYSDVSLATRVKNEENESLDEFAAKPLRFAFIAVRPKVAEPAPGPISLRLPTVPEPVS